MRHIGAQYANPHVCPVIVSCGGGGKAELKTWQEVERIKIPLAPDCHAAHRSVLAMFRHSFADLLLLPGSKSQSSKRRLSNMANTAIWKGLSAPAGGMWRKRQRHNSHPARSVRWRLPTSAALTRRESCDRRWWRSGDSLMDRNQLQTNPKCQDTNAKFCFAYRFFCDKISLKFILTTKKKATNICYIPEGYLKNIQQENRRIC